MEISLDKVKKIHFIGICGIGISAIARLLKTAGKEVSGSDVKSSPICDMLKKIGIKIYVTVDRQNLSKGGNDGRIL
jgi:UDP-N-acetylmuramate--alanine ligase